VFDLLSKPSSSLGLTRPERLACYNQNLIADRFFVARLARSITVMAEQANVGFRAADTTTLMSDMSRKRSLRSHFLWR